MISLHLVEIEGRVVGRLVKLAKRSQARFWALCQDLRRQGPCPLGWPELTRFDEGCYHCELDMRLVTGWTLRPEGRGIELLAPALSVSRLAFVRERQFEELCLSLIDPPVEVRFQGAGAGHFLAHLRHSFPDQVPEPQLTRQLVNVAGLGWHAQWSKIMTPGRCLNLYRQNAGLPIPRLAELGGFTRRELNDLEEDRQLMTEEKARTLALYLECDYRSLTCQPLGAEDTDGGA